MSKLTQHNHRAVFDDAGSYLEDKSTGERLWMKEKNGMYMLQLWVKREGF